MPDYIVCTRAHKGGSFSNEPGPTRFLKVPDKLNPDPSHEINRTNFIADTVGTPQAPKCEDLVVFVHGYNVTQADLTQRHRSLQTRLAKVGRHVEVICSDVIKLFVLLIAVLALNSCGISLVSSYDPVTDKAVQDLAGRAEAVIADATRKRGSYRKHAGFYTEAQGSISAIEMRSSLYKHNEAEIATMGRLSTALSNMESIHESADSLRPAETEGVRSLLRSLIHHQLAKKRSSQVLESPES